MKNLNKEVGKYGESLSEKFLKENGYIIIEENFSCSFGEVDIIAKDGSYICFIEVKTRYGYKYGSPLESITPYKQRKIIKVAQYYINLRNLHRCFFRFDALEVMLNLENKAPQLNLIRNAFQ